MEKLFSDNITVGELAARYPRARLVLEQHGIDYCCGGNIQFKDALRAEGVTESVVLDELHKAIELPAQEDEHLWADAPLTELVEHIVQKHHTFMKGVLPRLEMLFEKVIAAHGKTHADVLLPLRKVFETLRGEIEMHLLKEEQILFPYIYEAEESYRTGGEPPEFHCAALGNPINQMVHEHDGAGDALRKMRSLTSEYTPPQDACTTYRELYETLETMEKDLHEHIHLENNILFPKTMELEQKFESTER